MTKKKPVTSSSPGIALRSLSTVRKLPLLVTSLLYAGCLCFSVSASAADDNKAQLKSIQQDIADKEKSVRAQKIQRSNLLDQLESQERLIAQASRQLRQTQSVLDGITRDIDSLTRSVNALEKRQNREEDLLAQQLDAAFRQGQHSGLELMLSGEAGERNDRILTYFTYFNQARQQNISDLKQTRIQLAAQRQDLQQKQQQQQQLLSQQQAQQAKLEQARSARQKTLTVLESSLQKDQADLVEMRQNESRLQAKIARAEQIAKARAEQEAREAAQVRQRQAQAKASGSNYKPTEGEQELMARTGGLGRPAGQYPWPVRGKLLHRFGETLQGELRWKGLVIGAAEGTDVRAIADGRVIMADWLQGYGLVIVLEHGKGDMTLYGYNQSALVNVGDQVRAGQAIALVGTSGGRGIPSLYFEIRRQGQAVNPLSWLGK